MDIKKENSHEHIIFTHKFLLKSDVLSALFRANYLCMAKMIYFRSNIDKFEPLTYHPEKGFVKTELYNSDFLKHITSGKIYDYRFLQRITNIDVFKDLCRKFDEKS